MGKKEEEMPQLAHEIELTEREKKKVLTKIAEGRPKDEQSLIDNTMIRKKVAAHELKEAGKNLILLQEIWGYGNFRKNVEEKIGISKDTAYRWMNAAYKATLYPVLDDFSNISKVYALLEAPEEELKKFQDSGFFGDISKDAIDLMPVAKLRVYAKKMRDAKEGEKDAKDRTIERQNKELDKLHKRVDTFENGIPGEDEQAMIKALHAERNKFNGIMNLMRAIDADTLSRAMAFEVVGLYEYMAKYAEVEMLEAKRKFNDPGEQIAQAEIDEIEKKPVRGRWEKMDKMTGGRHA